MFESYCVCVIFLSLGRAMAAAFSGLDAAGAPSADVIRACAGYVNKLLRPRDKAREISGMKCLLLDKETVRSTAARSNWAPLLSDCVEAPCSFFWRTYRSTEQVALPLASLPLAEDDCVDGIRHE